jgi:uncharacterized membrane protein YeaQ/YmgE (transglycosylase-associated protein family)
MASVLWLVVVLILMWAALKILGSLGSILGVLLIGALAGWLAGKFMRGRGFGVLKNILVGIAGSIVGGILFGLLGFHSAGALASLVSATVGAIVLLYGVRLLQSR